MALANFVTSNPAVEGISFGKFFLNSNFTPLFLYGTGEIRIKGQNETPLSAYKVDSSKIEFWAEPESHHQSTRGGFEFEMTSQTLPHFHSERHSKWSKTKQKSSQYEGWDVDADEEIHNPRVHDSFKSPIQMVQDDPESNLATRANLPIMTDEVTKKPVSSSKNKTKISWQSTTTQSPPVLRTNAGLPPLGQFTHLPRGRQLPHPTTTLFLSEEAQRQKELELFYKTYDPKEGIVTAIVLGGFFVFVSLLVLYKTKCKPMWKNRRKRLTNTPVTQSVVEGDSFGGGANGSLSFPYPTGLDSGAPIIIEDETTFNCEEDFGFECIPLQPVCNDNYDEDDDDDIYFLDEFGNYVFPLSTPTIPGSCSCPSNEDLASNARRVSQVKRIDNNWPLLFNSLIIFTSQSLF